MDKQLMSENQSSGLDVVGGNKDELTRKYLLHRFWQTGHDFWLEGDRRFAWALSVILLFVIVLNIAASYGMNRWNCAIFDALESKDAGGVLFLSMIYFVILVVSVSFGVAQVYARMTLQRRWRRWLTNSYALGPFPGFLAVSGKSRG